MTTLFPHERTALALGRMLLLRPVDEARGLAPDEYAHNIFPDGGGNWIAWFGPEPTPEQREELERFTLRAYPNGEGFPCPLGRPGDTLTTDAGPVVVRSVRVVKCVVLAVEDALNSGSLHLPNRPTYAAECLEAVIDWDLAGRRSELPKLPLGDGPLVRLRRAWATLYPAHPWESAWAWCVEVEKA